jgi:hypothetical protein
MAMPKLLIKKSQDATDENYFIGGTGRRLQIFCPMGALLIDGSR